MKMIFLVFLLVPLIGSMTVEAQEFSALQNKVLETVKREKPGWKLSRKDLTEREAVYQWDWESESGKQSVEIRLFYGASKKATEEKLKHAVEYISVGPNRKMTGLGDEAYVWDGKHSGYGIIKFRKSNVYVEITAPPLALAEQLARQVAEMISK
ncbi:MAG: hypothetical protein L0229_16450 [Blastocatellia bacterium]|nr:hypothetical protein [Blastocatellia bacterium]